MRHPSDCARSVDEETIGTVNRHLISEWNGTKMEEPLLSLKLPGEQLTLSRRRSSIRGVAPNWSPTAAEVDYLWDASIACRELWCRYLNRTGSTRGEAWLAVVRAGINTALECTLGSNQVQVLKSLLESYPSLPTRAQRVCCNHMARPAARRVQLALRAHRSARCIHVHTVPPARPCCMHVHTVRPAHPGGAQQGARVRTRRPTESTAHPSRRPDAHVRSGRGSA